MSKLFERNEPNVTKNRNKYVGGSDVPVILGLSKFKTQYELAAEKAGIIKNEFKGNEYTAFGHAIEPQIREYINLTTDYTFIENSKTDETLGIRSNTDGVDQENKTLLEIKSHGAVPTMQVYKVQMQLYMYQNDLVEGLLALYERPEDFNVEFDADNLDMSVIVKRDDVFIEELLEQIRLFWLRFDWLRDNPGASEYDYNNCLENKVIPGGKRSMKQELQVKTIEFEPAKIEFNFEEIEKQLEENLKKYQGLTFTEKEAKECNKVVADLRKGKRLVDQYRINTKKKLIEPVKKFEDDCKTLNDKFDSVIDPLLEQSKEFDEKQRKEKAIKVERIKQTVIDDLQLVEEIAEQLEILDSFTNKTTTLKSIEEQLHEQATALINAKQFEEQNKQLIKSEVEIANLRNGLNLLESSYLSLAKYKETEEIKDIINKDVQIELERKRIKEEDENKAKIAAGAEKMKQSYDAEIKAAKEPEDEQEEGSEEQFIEVYEVVATEEDLQKLEEFMSSNSMTWKVVEDETL